MKEIHIEELKRIQLDILTAVDEFCKEYNINYSLSSGTLIGAVRHQGYIPWDDDIDIMMSRKDYNRFVETCYVFPVFLRLRIPIFVKFVFYHILTYKYFL